MPGQRQAPPWRSFVGGMDDGGNGLAVGWDEAAGSITDGFKASGGVSPIAARGPATRKW